MKTQKAKNLTLTLLFTLLTQVFPFLVHDTLKEKHLPGQPAYLESLTNTSNIFKEFHLVLFDYLMEIDSFSLSLNRREWQLIGY